MATIDGEIISADLYGEAELAIYKSDKLWLKLPFSRSKFGLPTRNQLRFSADGSSLLLDYVNKSGMVSTANWKLNEQAAHERVSFSPFRVATNGYVLESRTYERPKWLKNLQRIGRLGIDATPDEILYSTVFDQKGRRLLQVEHSFAAPNYLEDFAAFTDGGQGLVIYNNNGIEYYRVPAHGPYPVPYWLGLLASPFVWWGIRRWRRGIPQPAATTG